MPPPGIYRLSLGREIPTAHSMCLVEYALLRMSYQACLTGEPWRDGVLVVRAILLITRKRIRA